MSITELETIKKKFSELNLHPTYGEHEAVSTSEEAARIRGTQLNQGIKALVITNGQNQWAVVNVPSHKKVNIKRAAMALGWAKKEARMATPEEVLVITGCEVGAVPPFGHKTSITILVDGGVFKNQENAFNIGLKTHSVRIPTDEMKKIFQSLDAVEGDFSKE